VTYFVTAVNFFTEDTVTVVIAVGVGDINLAFGKHATQSSIYLYHDIIPVAGYAVDGNTDGYFLNKSTTHTSNKGKEEINCCCCYNISHWIRCNNWRSRDSPSFCIKG
jgi:hypothetical protein